MPNRSACRDWEGLRALPAAFLALIMACNPAETPSARRIIASEWDTLWVHHASLEDTTLIGPIGLQTIDSVLFVLDRGANRVTALSTRDGRYLWGVGRRGGGPDEFRQLMSFRRRDSSTIAVVDVGNARVSAVTLDGRISGTKPLPSDVVLYAECQVDSLTIGATFKPDTQFTVLGPHGDVRSRFLVPWSDLQGASPLLQQVMLTEVDGRGCVAAGVRGGGVALLNDARIVRSHEYIETVPLPEVSQSGQLVRVSSQAIAARDVKVFADTVFVLFQGLTPQQGRIIDMYHLGTLRYLGSIVLPVSAIKFAVDGRVFYLLRSRSGVFEVGAFRKRN
jgi:hypothetical protein